MNVNSYQISCVRIYISSLHIPSYNVSVLYLRLVNRKSYFFYCFVQRDSQSVFVKAPVQSSPTEQSLFIMVY